MGEAFLYGTGGGDNLKNAYAIISVEYPVGSTLTCSNAETGKTYKAGNTYGAWAFGVNAAGTWTITATDGAKTKSVSVEITAEGQCESVSLQYQLVLFDNGDNTEVTGGWSVYGQGNLVLNSTHVGLQANISGESAQNTTIRVCTQKKIDISDYQKITITFDAVKFQASVYIGDTPTSEAANALTSTEGTITLDVSAIKGLRYIGIANTFKVYGVFKHTVTASSIYLE